MRETIRRFFLQRLEPSAGPGDESAAASRLQVATCALLLEVAHADDEFSPAERGVILESLRRHFSLAESDAERIIALAEEERRESHDLYQFARLINRRYDRGEKLMVLELLWRVVYSDGTLEKHEDALMHKLAHLFQLRHEELIALKLRVKEQPPPAGA